jgi:hypothetical protein
VIPEGAVRKSRSPVQVLRIGVVADIRDGT